LSTPGPSLRSTVRVYPEGISREEFGELLYATIKTIGGILQLRQYRAQTPVARLKPKQLTEWGQREQVLLADLREQMKQLSDLDAAEVARRYPWVVEV
jgi:hypothetical protein